MKKVLLNALMLSTPLLSYAQIFQEDFDGNGPGISAWTIIDQDGLTPATSVNFITNGWNRIERLGADGNFGGPAGNFAAMSTSWYTPAGTSNDWLISPQVAVSGASPTLYWDAKAQDLTFKDGYKVMLAPNGGNTIADFTVQLYSTIAENSSWTSRTADLTPYIGQNIRFAFVNNSDDKFMLLVDNIKVDYTYIAPPVTYCGPLVFEDPIWGDEGDEPITKVEFAGISNTTSATIYIGNYHEFFLTQIANVTAGSTYPITLQGNTAGNYDNKFYVYIDWNQDGTFDPTSETYEVTTLLNNSTGVDGKSVTRDITVPTTALSGNTRMRIKKIYYDDTDYADPCTAGTYYGQAEDYTVNVTNSLVTQEVSLKNEVKLFPNPTSNNLTITSIEKINKIEIIDLTGKTILNKNINNSSTTIDVSSLTSGNYILKTVTTNGVKTSKFIKK